MTQLDLTLPDGTHIRLTSDGPTGPTVRKARPMPMRIVDPEGQL